MGSSSVGGKAPLITLTLFVCFTKSGKKHAFWKWKKSKMFHFKMDTFDILNVTKVTPRHNGLLLNRGCGQKLYWPHLGGATLFCMLKNQFDHQICKRTLVHFRAKYENKAKQA